MTDKSTGSDHVPVEPQPAASNTWKSWLIAFLLARLQSIIVASITAPFRTYIWAAKFGVILYRWIVMFSALGSALSFRCSALHNRIADLHHHPRYGPTVVEAPPPSAAVLA
jgi:hypothetical protein